MGHTAATDRICVDQGSSVITWWNGLIGGLEYPEEAPDTRPEGCDGPLRGPKGGCDASPAPPGLPSAGLRATTGPDHHPGADELLTAAQVSRRAGLGRRCRRRSGVVDPTGVGAALRADRLISAERPADRRASRP